MVNLLQGASFLSPKPFATNLDKGDDKNHFGYARLDENKLTHLFPWNPQNWLYAQLKLIWQKKINQ